MQEIQFNIHIHTYGITFKHINFHLPFIKITNSFKEKKRSFNHIIVSFKHF